MTDSYLTVSADVTAALAHTELRADDPLVHAALEFAARPWLDGVHTGAEAMAWGDFATAVQAVADDLFTGASPHVLPSRPAQPSAELTAAAIALTSATADVFARAAARPGEARAWQFSAAAAQLAEAAASLP
ncbi:hypothetical protein [Catellatospora sp. NPDC049133]|uniref:hypothetical protein n=1 Tax=Catellatospora sp. NPDC049133 TaxID=3155499 RepID=UPI0033DA0A41